MRYYKKIWDTSYLTFKTDFVLTVLLSSLLLLLGLLYIGIMFGYIYGWKAMPDWEIPVDFEPKIPVTVIIPARNEADNILGCLASIVNGTYPAKLLQIIVVNDFSEDKTAALVSDFIESSAKNKFPDIDISLIDLSYLLRSEKRYSANKKAAISCAVAQASGQLVVCTDADCLAPSAWLHGLTSHFEADPQLAILSAPVVFHKEGNLLQRFQSLDFMGLMGITGGGLQMGWHHMGNGANLAYRKTSFDAIGGFQGNEALASGDDMFLIQKMAKRWPGCVGFLKHKDMCIHTEAKADWRGFWQQRLRWGTKNAALPEWRIRLILLLVWLFCVSIWVSLGLTFLGFLPWQIPVCQLIMKLFADWILLRELCVYFERRDLLRWFFPSFFLHTAYIAIAGLASLVFKRYQWKGREIEI